MWINSVFVHRYGSKDQATCGCSTVLDPNQEPNRTKLLPFRRFGGFESFRMSLISLISHKKLRDLENLSFWGV